MEKRDTSEINTDLSREEKRKRDKYICPENLPAPELPLNTSILSARQFSRRADGVQGVYEEHTAE